MYYTSTGRLINLSGEVLRRDRETYDDNSGMRPEMEPDIYGIISSGMRGFKKCVRCVRAVVAGLLLLAGLPTWLAFRIYCTLSQHSQRRELVSVSITELSIEWPDGEPALQRKLMMCYLPCKTVPYVQVYLSSWRPTQSQGQKSGVSVLCSCVLFFVVALKNKLVSLCHFKSLPQVSNRLSEQLN